MKNKKQDYEYHQLYFIGDDWEKLQKIVKYFKFGSASEYLREKANTDWKRINKEMK